MKEAARPVVAVLVLALAFCGVAYGQAVDRSQVDPRLTWDLSDLYPSEKAWRTDRDALGDRVEAFAENKGKLAGSADALLAVLQERFELHKALSRLGVYAGMLSDLDTREAGPMAMKQESDRLWTRFNSVTSFLKPEILALPPDTLTGYLAATPALAPYKRYITNVVRMRPHTLDQASEALVAAAGQVFGGTAEAQRMLLNADLQWAEAKLPDGSTVAVDQAAYVGLRGNQDRETRKAVFGAFYDTLGRYHRTLGTMLNGKVKENLASIEMRGYDTVLEKELFGSAIPTEVYTNIIGGAHRHLPKLHRYLKIRKQLLGVDTLGYHDFYPALVQDTSVNYPFDKAFAEVRQALTVLGDELVGTLDEAYANRWIDVLPTVGKASGNYCSSHFDAHPYVFLNFTGRFPDMSMLAHELGHALHSHFSDSRQPYSMADYTSFAAETAASTNEALVVEKLMAQVKDPKQRLAVLTSYAEKFRQTVFRQALFAEFELRINERAEAGESLTGDDYSALYLELLRKYYGHNEGVCVIDEAFGHEWGFISHFYIGFYNYYYAGCFTAALAIAERIGSGQEEMVEKYLEFLSAGDSADTVELLARLGVDMRSEGPFDLAMARFERVLDEIDELLADADQK